MEEYLVKRFHFGFIRKLSTPNVPKLLIEYINGNREYVKEQQPVKQEQNKLIQPKDLNLYKFESNLTRNQGAMPRDNHKIMRFVVHVSSQKLFPLWILRTTNSFKLTKPSWLQTKLIPIVLTLTWTVRLVKNITTPQLF